MVVAVALSYFFPSFTMKESMGNTLYTVAGIMFSIGLSMTVISSTNSIKNPAFKEPVRKGIKDLRNSFITSFILATVTYMYSLTSEHRLPFLNEQWVVLLSQLYTIFFLIYNFLRLQALNEKIEDMTM